MSAPRLVVAGRGIVGRVGGRREVGGGHGAHVGGSYVSRVGIFSVWGWGYRSCKGGEHAGVHEVVEVLCGVRGDYVVSREEE